MIWCLVWAGGENSGFSSSGQAPSDRRWSVTWRKPRRSSKLTTSVEIELLTTQRFRLTVNGRGCGSGVIRASGAQVLHLRKAPSSSAALAALTTRENARVCRRPSGTFLTSRRGKFSRVPKRKGFRGVCTGSYWVVQLNSTRAVRQLILRPGFGYAVRDRPSATQQVERAQPRQALGPQREAGSVS